MISLSIRLGVIVTDLYDLSMTDILDYLASFTKPKEDVEKKLLGFFSAKHQT